MKNDSRLTLRQLLGLDQSALIAIDGHYLLPDAADAFRELSHAAREQGFDLRIASGFRSFERQRGIWNRKLSGEATVVDDCDRRIDVLALDVDARLNCVLRFSALPGTSRHHWGSDMDVFDAAAVDADYRVQLSSSEVGAGGVFAPLHDWLDQRMASQQSFGFFRPYDRDRGGVAPERWHLSYAPQAHVFAQQLSATVLRDFLDQLLPEQRLALQSAVEERLGDIFERFVQRVAVDPRAAKYSGAGTD